MKKNLYLLFVVTLFSLQAFAQDKLYKKNGDVVEAKVLEVNEAEIKYKIFTDQEGPTYTVDKDRLAKIIYQGGREETFKGSLRDIGLYEDQAKSAIKVNFIAPLLGFTQINYEHNLKPGRSYEISLGIIGLGKRQKMNNYRYDETTNSSSYDEVYRKAAGAFVGAGYKFIKLPNFIRNGDKYSHIMQGIYAKPEVIVGVYGQNKYQGYSQQPTTATQEKETVAMGALVINLGKQWVLGDAFLIDIYGGAGYAIDNQNYDYNNEDNFTGNHFGLMVGGDTGLGFTGGFKIGLLLNTKKPK